jgi:hypothetical protein
MAHSVEVILIKSLVEYVGFLTEHCKGETILFRGMTQDWPLVPSIARPSINFKRPRVESEKIMLRQFKHYFLNPLVSRSFTMLAGQVVGKTMGKLLGGAAHITTRIVARVYQCINAEGSHLLSLRSRLFRYSRPRSAIRSESGLPSLIAALCSCSFIPFGRVISTRSFPSGFRPIGLV